MNKTAAISIAIAATRQIDHRTAVIGDRDLDPEPAIPEPALANGKPKFPLAPVLRAHMAAGRITGEYHRGRWTDVGTPERLARLDAQLTQEAL